MAGFKSLIIVAALCVSMAASAPAVVRRRFDSHKVYRVVPQTEKDVGRMMTFEKETESLNLDWWLRPRLVGVPVDVRVQPEHQADVERYMSENGIKYSHMIENLQELIDEEFSSIPTSADAFNFTQYNTYEDVTAWVKSLPATYPDLVTVFNVGTSSEGREMPVVKFTGKGNTTNAVKPGFWFDGGIHAREWITVATVVGMLNEFLTQYGKDPTVTKLIDSVEFYVLPIFNPDGYKYTWTTDRMWRKTRHHTGHLCVGVDPNRNWDFEWDGAGTSRNPCSESYEGPKAFSEIEVSSVGNFIKNTTNINGYINFHSYSQLWMSPWGYTDTKPKDYETQEALSKAAVTALEAVHGTKYQYGPIATTIYPASGSSADYTYGAAGVVYSYGVELRDTGEHGFILPASQIQPSIEETFAALKVFAQFLIDNPKQSVTTVTLAEE